MRKDKAYRLHKKRNNDFVMSDLNSEKFDYTHWQREYFDEMAPGEFHENAVEYAKEHPFKGNAIRI